MSVLAELNSTNPIPCTAYKQEVKSSGVDNQAGNDGPLEDRLDAASGSQRLLRSISSYSFYESEEEDNEAEADEDKLKLGPLVPLLDELEHDQDDESLKRWKEQLLGSLYLDPPGVAETVEPKVTLAEIKIVCEGRADIVIPKPFTPNSRGHMFSLKEGSCYSLKFAFLVRHNIVPGLTYINTVWKNGLKVDRSKVMIGTFSPQLEPYTHTTEGETTPSGILARGAYTAKTKFFDDDKRCHFELEYSFEIRRDWHDD
ncbi:hypothetical protein O6H91_17G022100 [Diphasiastrum complanatum]|uniref:Uncharacterized protein n=2 Tax=Diphasiastrum complanatum TaxID=34168 RepID=A0ACC2B4U9_DIPCM|nr:hypothetical protein O6H91_17G022100 [Diphasiastrum complanatum]KAJ7524791.1 hypothetical protein O6H91_17G022100 [Diphasiastrum complanatum]